jgi:hypothetical protein
VHAEGYGIGVKEWEDFYDTIPKVCNPLLELGGVGLNGKILD